MFLIFLNRLQAPGGQVSCPVCFFLCSSFNHKQMLKGKEKQHLCGGLPWRSSTPVVIRALIPSPVWLRQYRICLQRGATGSIPGLGRLPGQRNGNPLQYSCLEKSLGKGAWRDTTEGLTHSTIPSRGPTLMTHHVTSQRPLLPVPSPWGPGFSV